MRRRLTKAREARNRMAFLIIRFLLDVYRVAVVLVLLSVALVLLALLVAAFLRLLAQGVEPNPGWGDQSAIEGEPAECEVTIEKQHKTQKCFRVGKLFSFSLSFSLFCCLPLKEKNAHNISGPGEDAA